MPYYEEMSDEEAYEQWCEEQCRQQWFEAQWAMEQELLEDMKKYPLFFLT